MSAVLYGSRSGYHYILVGPQYLSWKANKRGIDMRLIELADRVNRNTPTYVTRRIMTLLNESDVSMLEAAILVVGVAYKPNVSDTRESPALDVIDILEDYDVPFAIMTRTSSISKSTSPFTSCLTSWRTKTVSSSSRPFRHRLREGSRTRPRWSSIRVMRRVS